MTTRVLLCASLRRLRDEYVAGGIPPEEINAGYCADVADIALERIGYPDSAEIVADEDLMRDEAGIDADDGDAETWAWYAHTFIRLDGRFYDAEAVDGVDDWRDLPIYQRGERPPDPRDTEALAVWVARRMIGGRL